MKLYQIIICLTLLVSAIVLPLIALAIVFGTAAVAFYFYDSRIFRRLQQKLLWFFIVILIVVQTLFIGESDSNLFGISYSYEQLLIGLRIALRAVTIMLTVSYIISIARAGSYKSFLQKIGMSDFEGIFQLSNTFFPAIKQSLKELLDALKNRNKEKFNIRKPIESISSFLADTIKQIENLDKNNKHNQNNDLK